MSVAQHAKAFVIDPRPDAPLAAMLHRSSVTVVKQLPGFGGLKPLIADEVPDFIAVCHEVGERFIEGLSLAIELGSGIPIVVVVPPEAQGMDVAAMLQAGATDCWRQPIESIELTARVWRLMLVGKDRQRLSRLLHYTSPLVAQQILDSDQSSLFGSVAKRKRLTFMFLDIRNYTQLTDSLPPETISDILAEYNGGVCQIVNKYGGCINKFLGDGLFAIFGDPIPDRDHKLNAIKAALEIRTLVQSFSERMMHLPKPFHVGIGLNTGKAIVGNFGTPTQIDYTAIGPAVNLAARLQGFAKSEQIIASLPTYEDCREQVEVVDERLEKVRGLEDPVPVGEIVGLKSA